MIILLSFIYLEVLKGMKYEWFLEDDFEKENLEEDLRKNPNATSQSKFAYELCVLAESARVHERIAEAQRETREHTRAK